MSSAPTKREATGPVLTAEEFRDSELVKRVRTAPKGCVVLQEVAIPLSHSWADVPKRVAAHSDVRAIGCDALYGIRFTADFSQDFTQEAAARPHGYPGCTGKYGPNPSTNRWNWVAINLRTGKGVTSRQSLSYGSGKLTLIDLSPEAIAKEAADRQQKQVAANQRHATTLGLKAGTLCLVQGDDSDDEVVIPMKKAERRLQKRPKCYQFEKDDSGFWWLAKVRGRR